MSTSIPVLDHIGQLLEDASRRNDRVIKICVGSDLETPFKDPVGAAVVDGAYLGVPVSFGAIDPTTVLAGTEPKP